MKPFLPQEAATEITSGLPGLAHSTCLTRNCINEIWINPCDLPYGDYCKECKAGREEKQVENEFQDKINEAKEDE